MCGICGSTSGGRSKGMVRGGACELFDGRWNQCDGARLSEREDGKA